MSVIDETYKFKFNLNITLINASNWLCIDNADKKKYIANVASEGLQGFAWLEINKHTNSIVGCRDHFGQEPFYYFFSKGLFIFGSYIRDILRYLPTAPKFSRHLVRDCFMRYPADDPIDDPPFTQETYYSGIFRVTPGHHLFVNDYAVFEKPYWLLDINKPKLYYRDPRDYVKHFAILLDEALRISLGNMREVALEFSGGLDSTMILVASRNLDVNAKIFTHVPPINREPTAEDINIKKIIQKYNLENKHVLVDAENFHPILIFKKYAKLLSGPPPNLNCVLSSNLHEAIIYHGHRYVLSGYGGDDCVSFNFPIEKANSEQELYEYEFDILQGKYAHEIRMRLEYSSLITKFLGLKYIYPLLYPPLIEYCFSLPLAQKFNNGMTRCLAREFLAQYIDNLQLNTKQGAFVPSTMQKCRDYYRLGKFKDVFVNLPYAEYISSRSDADDKLLLQIYAYMILHR